MATSLRLKPPFKNGIEKPTRCELVGFLVDFCKPFISFLPTGIIYHIQTGCQIFVFNGKTTMCEFVVFQVDSCKSLVSFGSTCISTCCHIHCILKALLCQCTVHVRFFYLKNLDIRLVSFFLFSSFSLLTGFSSSLCSSYSCSSSE
jgi:hypothetical protein